MCTSAHQEDGGGQNGGADPISLSSTIIQAVNNPMELLPACGITGGAGGLTEPPTSSCSSSSTSSIKSTTTSKRVRGSDGYRQRAAALCVRRAANNTTTPQCCGSGIREEAGDKGSLKVGQNDLEVLLVSGRGEKNYWVLPGGGVEKEESSEEAVLREFMEEAGIKGSIDAVLGEFTDHERYHRTTLYMLSVIEVFDEWEDYETGRERRWMNADEALRKIKKNQMSMMKQSLRIAADILNKGLE